MQGDLISRSALLEAIDKMDKGSLYLPLLFKDMVKRQPTAYDVEKVVAELEEKTCELLHMDKETFRKYEEHKHIVKLTLHEVESIVRNGGKE